ncbi:MAG: glycosyltransferase [Calditrichaeota bacterium]|nr:glycosyltransferase [Calditrichota bacterium]
MKELNIIFLGGFEYPQGMAGTKRIQHVIDGLKNLPDVTVRVVILRQLSSENVLAGTHNGIPYETVIGDFFRLKAALMLPLLHIKAKRIIRRLFLPDQANILYVYSAPALDNLPIVRYARRLGFKVIFDIVDDDFFAFNISRSPWHRINTIYRQSALKKISSLTDGIVVISLHLKEKYHKLTQDSVPIHYRPVSVDIERYPATTRHFGNTINLFYSGGFSIKDGLPFLFDAFDQLAARHTNIHFILTGKGNEKPLRWLFTRIGYSPFRDRIDYKGYLDDDAYYAALNTADIPCMTRIYTDWNNSGFPFKLGEFLATGRPVIASRISDVEDIFENRRDAMLVKPDDSGEIVAAIEYLIANPGEAVAIGTRGREKARLLFDYRKQGQELLEFLRNLHDQDALQISRKQ